MVCAITVAVKQKLLAFGTCGNENERNMSCPVYYVLSKPVLLDEPKSLSYIGASVLCCLQATIRLFCSTVRLLLRFLSSASSV